MRLPSFIIGLFISLLTTFPLFGGSIERRIASLSPHLSYEKVKRYAALIDVHSKKQGLDPIIVVAVARQESNFKNVVTVKKIINLEVFDRIPSPSHYFYGVPFDQQMRKKNPWDSMILKKEPLDIGIMQVNVHTARHLGIDIERLIKDEDFQIESGIFILGKKIRECRLRENPWTCYHSKTPSLSAKYRKDVARYMPREYLGAGRERKVAANNDH